MHLKVESTLLLLSTSRIYEYQNHYCTKNKLIKLLLLIGMLVIEVSLGYAKEEVEIFVELPGSPSVKHYTQMAFVWIEPGSFMMGSPRSERGRSDNEGPQHEVTISRGFYLSKFEITQAQWKALMGENPSYFKADNHPVEQVSWLDCVKFCNKLSEHEGRVLAYEVQHKWYGGIEVLPVPDASGYRLPTEAEWEYACRAGTKTRWGFGNDKDYLDDYAWYRYNTMDIGEDYAQAIVHTKWMKLPNAWGLYHMHGNVWEWCQDWFGPYSKSRKNDPTGPERGRGRILRGGGFHFTAPYTRSAYRAYNAPTNRSRGIGARVLRGK